MDTDKRKAGKGEYIPAGRRDAYLRALGQTFRDFLTGRNTVRKIREAYRFHTVSWSAANFRNPSLSVRLRLFLEAGNPVRTVREDFRMKHARLLGRWERDTIRKVSRSLIVLGGTPLGKRGKDVDRLLARAEKDIRRLQGYPGCPCMESERLLLAAYRYIFAVPSDGRFGTLCPDDICEMLGQNGVDRKELCRQNYGGLLRHGVSALYGTVPGENGTNRLRPSGMVRLEMTPSGWSMVPLRPAMTGGEAPPLDFGGHLPPSEKLERPPGKKKPGKAARQRKAKGAKIR